ncbi:MAG: M48 family metallopeptidase [Anaerolineales bacterium]|nr:M48 family metallopeptidase [Anaerolineales bacterium]
MNQSYSLSHNGETIEVRVKKDKRLKTSSRWVWENDRTILLRVPFGLQSRQIPDLLQKIKMQLSKSPKKRTGRTDQDLQIRAERINKRYFRGMLSWKAIRWVGNMKYRLGSCTQGGATNGHIRINQDIQDWPDWVVDYIIAHELAHRKYPNHSKEFWDFLKTAFPDTEKARAFISGVQFARQINFEDEP